MSNALLKEVESLKEGGFSEKQASTLIFFHKSQIDTHLATKKDILLVEKDIEKVRLEIEHVRSEIEHVRSEIEHVRSELKKDIEGVRSELTKYIENVRSELIAKIENMRLEVQKDMETLKLSLTLRLGSMVFGSFLVLAGFIAYLSQSDSKRYESYHSQAIQTIIEGQNRILLKLEDPKTPQPLVAEPKSSVEPKKAEPKK